MAVAVGTVEVEAMLLLVAFDGWDGLGTEADDSGSDELDRSVLP